MAIKLSSTKLFLLQLYLITAYTKHVSIFTLSHHKFTHPTLTAFILTIYPIDLIRFVLPLQSIHQYFCDLSMMPSLAGCAFSNTVKCLLFKVYNVPFISRVWALYLYRWVTKLLGCSNGVGEIRSHVNLLL